MDVGVDQTRQDELVRQVDQPRPGRRGLMAVHDLKHLAVLDDQGRGAPRRLARLIEQGAGVDIGLGRLGLGRRQQAEAGKGERDGPQHGRLSP